MEANVIKFLKDIKSTDGVVIIFNNDVDGISSCAIIKKYLQTLDVDPYIVAQPMPPDKNLLRRVQTGAPNKVILLDMNIDQMPQLIAKMKSFADILIIDHHIVFNNLNSTSVVHHNPRIDDPKVYQSTTYLAYKVVSKIMDITDDLWVAATGAVADYDLNWSQDVMKEAQKKWNMKVFHKVAAMLESARVTRLKTCEQIVNLMIETSNPDEIMADKALLKAYNEINADIDTTIADAEANAEHVGNVILYNINSKYHINSIVSTKLSEKWHSKLLIIWSKAGKSVSGSVRNQDKNIDANKVLRAAAKEIRGSSAGGHEAAAGFTVPAENWDEFRKNVIEIVQKMDK